MVAEDEVDGAIEGVGQEFQVAGGEVAAAEDDGDIAHPLFERGAVDAGIDLVGNGERLDRHAGLYLDGGDDGVRATPRVKPGAKIAKSLRD